MIIPGDRNPGRIHVRNRNAINLLKQSYANELDFTCEFQSDDILSAISLSSGYVNQILDNLVFVTGGPAYDIKILKAYEITPTATIREFWQYFPNVIEKVGSKYSDIEASTGLIHSFLKVQEERVLQALHWYRKSLRESDTLDRFTYIWIGLETLNPLIKKIYPGESETAKCKNCGHPRKFEGTAALKKFFEACSNGALYSKARNIRQELLHGHKNLDEIVENIHDIMNPLATVLRSAICSVSGIDKEKIVYDIDLAEAINVTIVVYMKFGPFIVDESDPGFEDPYAILDVDLEEKGNTLIFQPKITLPLLKSGVGIESLGFDIIGKTGYPFKKASITLSNRKVEGSL